MGARKGMKPSAVTATALAAVRGRAPGTQPNIRRLAACTRSGHTCPTAAVAFACRGGHEPGLRGHAGSKCPLVSRPLRDWSRDRFENLLRLHGHAELRRVLTEGLGVDFARAAVENLRQGYQPNRTGLAMRASVTKGRLKEIVTGPPEPIVLDGAVLRAEIGGIIAFFEADEIAIGVGGQILVGENKSWPVVDEQPTDEDSAGSALDQAATYVLLGRRTLSDSGVDIQAGSPGRW